MMKKNCIILFMVVGCLSLNSLKAQYTLDSIFNKISHFVKAQYTVKDMKNVKRITDSTRNLHYAKHKQIDQISLKGKIKVNERLNVRFSDLVSLLKKTPDTLSAGKIYIYYDDSDVDDSLLNAVLDYTRKYKLDFDSVLVLKDCRNCGRYKTICLSFYNYGPETNKVLGKVDISMRRIVKEAYFDYYFGDVETKTSEWKLDTLRSMEMSSKELVAFMRNKNISIVFDIMKSKNKAFNWFLAEGLWFYNKSHAFLSEGQLKTVEEYNGKNGMITFRTENVLEKAYPVISF